jgi:glycosyltransferase involved in cell wall biosynthesis
MAELARLFRSRFGSYHWLTARLENFTLPRTAGVFCNSAYTENLVRPRARKIWRVPNPLRLEFFRAIPAGTRPPVLLNIGAVIERKRQLELLAVADKLRRRGLKFELHFIGRLNLSEPYAAKFRERLTPLEAAGCARYLGEFSTPELLQQFDAAAGLVHFPFEESFGLVVGEALARNLKLFGVRLGGIAEIAAGAPGAELFDLNDWGGLTEAIAGWLAQGHPPAENSAGLMCERYHPTVIARRHLEIYREVISQP